MKHRHSITIDESGLAHVTIVGNGDEKDAQSFVDDAQKVFKQHPYKRVDALVDMSESGYSNYQGIEIYNEFLKEISR